MIIKRVELHNWKNFRNCAVNLTERCFIVGANASGKSNFIDALRFLRDVSKQSGGLQTAVEDRGGITKIRCLAARRQTEVSLTVHLGEPDNDNLLWKYHLGFIHTGENQVRICEEKAYSYTLSKFVLERNVQSPGEDEETVKYTHLEQVNANKEFRELQYFFRDIEYLNIIPQLVRESASAAHSYKREDYYGRDFLDRLAKMNEETRDLYFSRINEFLKVAVPQLEELTFVDTMGVPHLEVRYKHWRAHGSKQQEAQFSDGTLRLIGFLFALLDNSGVILLEEPEINLHAGVISQLPEFIAKIQRVKKEMQQVIITTHSYDILSSKGISPNEVIVLQNTPEGTTVKKAGDIDEIKAIVDAGFPVADAIIPYTKPEDIEEMSRLNFD
jgi:predicted ATPase